MIVIATLLVPSPHFCVETLALLASSIRPFVCLFLSTSLDISLSSPPIASRYATHIDFIPSFRTSSGDRSGAETSASSLNLRSDLPLGPQSLGFISDRFFKALHCASGLPKRARHIRQDSQLRLHTSTITDSPPAVTITVDQPRLSHSLAARHTRSCRHSPTRLTAAPHQAMRVSHLIFGSATSPFSSLKRWKPAVPLVEKP